MDGLRQSGRVRPLRPVAPPPPRRRGRAPANPKVAGAARVPPPLRRSGPPGTLRPSLCGAVPPVGFNIGVVGEGLFGGETPFLPGASAFVSCGRGARRAAHPRPTSPPEPYAVVRRWLTPATPATEATS